MNGPRPVLITPRFWPLVGGSEVMLTRLATAIRAQGIATTVLTGHWQADWPREFDHSGIRVVRLTPPGRGIFAQARYLRSMKRWLRTHRQEFDMALVAGLRHEAAAAVSASRDVPFPVVLRVQGLGLHGDCHWQLDARCGARIKKQCFRAAAFIAPCRAIEREVIAAGYARDRIHFLPDGVPTLAVRTPAEKREARLALAESEPSLAVEAETPVAVCVSRLAAGKGHETLLQAWRDVGMQRPDARLWLVGDGPERERIQLRVRQLGLPGKVTLAGAFDDVDDFYRAADLFVLPNAEEVTSLALREAMSWGLPVVTTATEENAALLAGGGRGELVAAGDTAALTSSLLRVLNESATSRVLAAAAREYAVAELSLERCVTKHLDLFRAVVDASRRQK